MKKDYIYITYYQVMAFLHKYEDMKKEDPSFNDEIVNEFADAAIEKASNIYLALLPEIIVKLIPHANKYKMSKSLFVYLTNLTGIDVFDVEIQKMAKQRANELVESAIQDLKEKTNSYQKSINR